VEQMETNIAARLEEATGLLESILKRLDEREESVAGNVERISATVEQSRREIELAERLMNVEKELTTLKASSAASVMSSLRRTIPSAAAEMLTKYGAGDGPVDVRTLDQALNGLSLEQRIAVKSQLLRSGAIAQ